METKPTLAVATRWFGVRSQVWMWRQIRAFKHFSPRVLSWTYENPAEFPLGDIRIELLNTEEEPNGGKSRWLWRTANLLSGNLYGTRGAELAFLTQILRSPPPAVMLCHFGHVGLRMLPLARAKGCPIVVHFHGDDISSALNDRYYRWSLRRNLNRFDAIVCVGTEQERKLKELGADQGKVSVIPCGVPTEEFVPAEADEKRPLTFICVSRLVPQKGVDYSIRAFARVARLHSSARLIIAGDGRDEQALKALSHQEGVGRQVDFVGSQPPIEIRLLLRRSDVFLQHSLTHQSGWFEGFGVSIAEASATGLPVVVSRCGGITDQVVDGVTGTVVDQRDVAGMAEAMLRLAESRDLRLRMGVAGRERMIASFDTVKQVEKLERLLMSVMA